MNIDEPRIALAASPREWAQRLHRHVADHGGALVRATVLHPRDALVEDADVFVVDDTTSFLSPRLVDELHRRGRHVLGVFDADDPRGKGELVDCGVDDVIERGAPPEAFVAAIHALVGRNRVRVDAELAALGGAAPTSDGDEAAPTLGAALRGEPPPPAQRQTPPLSPGQVTVVAGVAGGVGATEIALALAAASGRRGDSTVLVDADDVAPSVAQRLGAPLYPNVRAAVDAMQQRTGTLADVLTPVPAGRFSVLPGLASARNWGDLRPGEVADLLRALAMVRRHVVCNVGHRIEDLPATAGGAPRYGLARQLLANADRVVAVAAPTPVGIARLLEWLADVVGLLGDTVPHVVVNGGPPDRFRRGEIVEELARSGPMARLWFVPHDSRVTEVAWRGELPSTGPFTRAVGLAADVVLPTHTRVSRRGWRRWKP